MIVVSWNKVILAIINNSLSFICFETFFSAHGWQLGKISAQTHTIVKQICFPNGNVLFLSLFSLSKNWMHNVVWGCAETLPTTEADRYCEKLVLILTTYRNVFDISWSVSFCLKPFHSFEKTFLRCRDAARGTWRGSHPFSASASWLS